MNGPLAGIRVIDFGRYIAGPYCAMMLADFGAEVIRIERRGGGEDRYVGPVAETGEGGLFLGFNRNKKGITLDPLHAQSGEVKRRLIESADLVVANLPFDVMRRMGIDYESLKSIKAEVILVMVSTFGPDGPYARRVGFDSVVQAMSGAMSLTGFPEVPVRSVVPFEDFGTALHAAFGAMAALYERQRTGRGQLVETSLLATGVSFMQSLLAEHYVTGIKRTQRGNAAFHAAPSDAYQTRDGWVMVPTIGRAMFERWAKLVGRPDLIDDSRCADDLARADHYELIGSVMAAWASERTTEEALRQLEEARIPAGPVYDLEGVLADPQVKARELVELVEYPGAPRPVPVPATPVRLSRTPGAVRRRAPTLGEHTEEVLQQLGFTPEEIMALREAGVV